MQGFRVAREKLGLHARIVDQRGLLLVDLLMLMQNFLQFVSDLF